MASQRMERYQRGFLESIARLVPPSGKIIQSVSRAAFEVRGELAYENTIKQVVSWMRSKSNEIPVQAFVGSTFDVGVGGNVHAEAQRSEGFGARLWSGILDDPCKEVARRTWVTEAVVGEKDGRTAFGARLFCVTGGVNEPFSPSRPAMVREILSKLEAEIDGVPLRNDVLRIDRDEDFNIFWKLLNNPNRVLPILAAASKLGEVPFLKFDDLSRRISGLAHLFDLSADAAWRLTDRVGKKLSVFVDPSSDEYVGAARIYGSDFDPVDSNPFDHGLWLGRARDSEGGAGAKIRTNIALGSYQFGSDQPSPRLSSIRGNAAECRKGAERASWEEGHK